MPEKCGSNNNNKHNTNNSDNPLTSRRIDGGFPDSTRRGDVEAGKQQSDSSSTSFYTFYLGENNRRESSCWFG